MLTKTFSYALVLACGAFVVFDLPSVADDKKDDKPALSGAWGKKDGELKIEFVDKDVMKIAPHGDPAMIAIVCNYTLEKEGRVNAKVTDFEGKEDIKKMIQQHFPIGFKFTFKWEAKDNSAKLDDVTGKEVDMLKSHLEGDFEKK